MFTLVLDKKIKSEKMEKRTELGVCEEISSSIFPCQFDDIFNGQFRAEKKVHFDSRKS